MHVKCMHKYVNIQINANGDAGVQDIYSILQCR